jgi:hypothetical protein
VKALADQLEAHGLDPLAAQIWSTFVGGVVEALVAAERSLKEPEAWAEYCGAQRGAFGKVRARGVHAGRALPTEEGLSGELVERMRTYLGHVDSEHVLRKWHVMFDGENRVRSKRKKGKYADRTDIRAIGIRQFGSFFPEFVLEAKVVDTPGEVAKRLLGGEGLGCDSSRMSCATMSPSGSGGSLALT